MSKIQVRASAGSLLAPSPSSLCFSFVAYLSKQINVSCNYLFSISPLLEH